jgi:hypothetical protein
MNLSSRASSKSLFHFCRRLLLRLFLSLSIKAAIHSFLESSSIFVVPQLDWFAFLIFFPYRGRGYNTRVRMPVLLSLSLSLHLTIKNTIQHHSRLLCFHTTSSPVDEFFCSTDDVVGTGMSKMV